MYIHICSGRTGVVKVHSLKVGLVALCHATIQEKYACKSCSDYSLLHRFTSMNTLTSHYRYVRPDEQWKKPTCLFKPEDSHSRLITGMYDFLTKIKTFENILHFLATT